MQRGESHTQNLYLFYIFKWRRVKRGVSCVLSSTFAEMYKGKLHRSMHPHSLIRLEISVHAHFSTLVRTPAFSVQTAHLFRNEARDVKLSECRIINVFLLDG